MAKISWTEEAQRWLNDIFEYIASDNPEAAARTVQGIYDRAKDLTAPSRRDAGLKSEFQSANSC